MAELGGVAHFIEAFGGDTVSDRYISLGPKRVIRKGMGVEILPQIAVRPVEQRQKLEA
jgi:hypothetical protein